MNDAWITPTTVRAFRAGDLTVDIAADTQVGLRYPANFDVLGIDDQRPLVAVADGMGSGRGSTIAGRTTMDVFLSRVRAAGDTIAPEVLREAVAEAQRQVRAAAARLGELTGCTLTALLLDGPQAWIVQIGDSRVYRLRDGLLELLTTDHTAAWLGVIHGWYAADSPEAHAARYQLYRYVGHPGGPEPDVLNIGVRPGDILCVCTDGLAEQVPYQRLARVLAGDAVPAEMVAELLAEALAAGGRDNATAAVVRVAHVAA